MSFVPARTLQRVFPPIVTGPSAEHSLLTFTILTNYLGTVILLIGASLVGASGVPNWGGGSGGCQNFPTSGIFMLCPTTLAPRPLPYVVSQARPEYLADVPLFSWGSPEFIGLCFLSFVSIILTEIFGSPFMKNISIIVGLAVGCIVAGGAGYIDSTTIRSAPAITFLWSVASIYSPLIFQ
jgi:xanthine/uracil permease